MLVVTVWHSYCRTESIKDQISTDIGRVVQVSEPDLMARGVAVDLLRMAKRIGPQCEAAEHKNLSGEKNLTLDGVVEGWRSHPALQQRHRGTLNESTNVGVKTGGSQVGGPDLYV